MEAEKARAEALLYRMSGLLACFEQQGAGVGRANSGGSGTTPRLGRAAMAAVSDEHEAIRELLGAGGPPGLGSELGTVTLAMRNDAQASVGRQAATMGAWGLRAGRRGSGRAV